MIVDDDPSSRTALERLLEHAGHTVLTAANGPEALEVLSYSRPDLLLLDLVLPGMDGTDLLRHIRDDPRLASLRVVVLTGAITDSRRGELQPPHVDGLLAKPVDFESVRAILDSLAPSGSSPE